MTACASSSPSTPGPTLSRRPRARNDETYHELATRAERAIATRARTRPRKVKDDIVCQLGYKVLRQEADDVVEFSYRQPPMTADEVVDQARQRCNQENLHAQLKSDVRAVHAPVHTLIANWAYMTMAALAWSLNAWCALLLPVNPRWAERQGEQTPTPAHHGVPHPRAGLHQHPRPDRQDATPPAVTHLGLQPVPGAVLRFARRDLTAAEPPLSTSPPGWSVSDPANPRDPTEDTTTRRQKLPNHGSPRPSAPAIRPRRLVAPPQPGHSPSTPGIACSWDYSSPQPLRTAGPTPVTAPAGTRFPEPSGSPRELPCPQVWRLSSSMQGR